MGVLGSVNTVLALTGGTAGLRKGTDDGDDLALSDEAIEENSVGALIKDAVGAIEAMGEVGLLVVIVVVLHADDDTVD